MVVETKQMVVVLAVTEVNEDVVVQWLGWKRFGCRNRKGTFFVFWYRNVFIYILVKQSLLALTDDLYIILRSGCFETLCLFRSLSLTKVVSHLSQVCLNP